MQSEVMTKADLRECEDWIRQTLRESIKTEVTHESLPDWLERRRIIPEGTSPKAGRFEWKMAPYLREIADCLSETSPIQEVAVMKGARVLFTVTVLEGKIGYAIDVAPEPILYVGADKEAVEEVMDTRIGPMIDLCGLSHKIFSPRATGRSRSTGDTKQRKDFAGGRLRAIGPSVGAKLRGTGYSCLLLDEIDAWQNEVGTAGGKRKSEGSTMALILRRSDEYETTRKILYGSTPLLKSSSLIEPLFEAGDQSYYMVPCKHCGHKQKLVWSQLKFEVDDDGRLKYDSVHYECINCQGHWKNHDKVNFLRDEKLGGFVCATGERVWAEWVPTAKPRRPNMRSFHIPSFYSPVGFRSWESICQEWIEAGEDITKRQTIVNTVFGETWYEKGITPDYTKVMAGREAIADGEWGWTIGQWPDAALIWTVGIDTQDNRLECEVVAWGRNMESWSLGYHVFVGDTENQEDPCWTQLAELLDSRYGGLPVALALQDEGGHRATQVRNFCERYTHDRGQLMPCSGDAPRGSGRMTFKLFQIAGYSVRRADLQVDDLKAELYGFLNKSMPDVGLVPKGYCHFPREYGRKYFQGLMSEERIPFRTPGRAPRSKWQKIKGVQRNEPLDCRIYATGALYVFKEKFKEGLGLEKDVEMTWEDFWDLTEASLKA